MSSHANSKRMNIDNVNPFVKAAKYAVRGELDIRAEELQSLLREENCNLPFKEIVSAHIGNPHGMGQQPITFFRQVLSLLEYPALLDKKDVLINQLGYQPDVLSRAEWLLKEVGSLGSYSPIRGVPAIKQSVARFLKERDGYPASPEDIFLTAGASLGVSTVLQVLCAGPTTGILVPIPQYPIYTASLCVFNACCVPYHLDESKGWGVDMNLLEAAHDSARSKGIEIRGIVVINPGNPTGAVLSLKGIREVIDFASRKRLVIIADEVYQENVFRGKFFSFKSVLRTMQTEHAGQHESVELVSFHSVSKGMVGECGHRGGYFELVGFDPAVAEQIYKAASLPLCAPITGQCMVELMVNPPREGDPSYLLYKQEFDSISSMLRQRAMLIYEAVLAMRGVSCANPQGSLYVFPIITLPQNACRAAREKGVAVDEYYCSRLLDSTGICIMPGTAFGQKDGTFHLRSTFLPQGTGWVHRWVQFHDDFIDEYL